MLHAASKNIVIIWELYLTSNAKADLSAVEAWSTAQALKICSLQLTVRGCILEGDGVKPDIRKLWLSNLNQGGSKQGGLEERDKGTWRQLQGTWYCCCLSEIAIAAHGPTLVYQEVKRLFFCFWQSYIRGWTNLPHIKSERFLLLNEDI